MKKLLVFLLCAMMALSMMAPAIAAEEKNLLALDFEALPEGNISRPADKMYSSHPKTGTIKVITVDGNKVMEVARSAEKADPYFDLFYVNGTTATLQSAQGASQQIVLEYDLYIKAACDAMQWSIGISKEYPASLAGSFVMGDTGVILGDLGLYKYADIKADPRPAPLFRFELKKWYKVAVAIDSAKDTYSLFVDGKMVIEGAESTVKAKDAESPSVLRINYRTVEPAGEAAMYVDNIKVYDGTKPRGYVAPAVTEKPAATTTTAPKAPQTFDAGIIAIVTAAASLSTAVVLKKKR
ncbi:MAG: hypothetical protein E7662_09425 [Ruminococcaceae bacterium]|nr:hypothetical protein [Oscillospiraceae bacterium]